MAHSTGHDHDGRGIALRLDFNCRKCANMAVPPPSYPAWVARLRGPGKSAARRPPVKPPRPLVLGNQVSNRRLKLGEATCVTEMSLMMACWKRNEFNDAVCAKEIQTFLDCAAKAEVIMIFGVSSV
ncbi:hypothetical protein lerEdw1_015146 [Lerista edwardsae]|nr:hypothetical protein lerEdw1_015147 [Lerista edwardsae]KAJ6614781.1 hypothetical protein lerEdw1_015146 [Lerista edwardsae]